MGNKVNKAHLYRGATVTPKDKENMRSMRLNCKTGLHKWGNSASPEYEKCIYCKAVRKKSSEKQVYG